jgi:hypothetical protein
MKIVGDKHNMPVPESSGSSLEVPPETLSAIAAAVTAFLGKKVKIHSAKMLQTPDGADRWAREGRVMIQTSHNLAKRGR